MYDLLAIGSSVKNIISLVNELDVYVDSLPFIIELEFLKGKERLEEYINEKTLIHSVLKY